MNQYAVQITRTLSVLEHSEIEVEAVDHVDAEKIALQQMKAGAYPADLDYQMGDTVGSTDWQCLTECDTIIELGNKIFLKGTP